MSIFDEAKSEEAQPQAGLTNTETTQQETQSQDSYLQKLVETRGENWKDPEVLAKGKMEADAYIKNLEDQLTQMRDDLGKQDYAAKLLAQLEGKASATTNEKPLVSNNNNNNDGGTATEGNTNLAVSEDVLKSLVEKTLTERDSKVVTQQNISVVDSKLEELYGTEARSHVVNKSKELGVSIERMQEIASESPSAFFSLIGEPQKSFKPMTQGSVRTEGVNNQSSSDRDWSYYQNLRRENKHLYYTPKIQQQLMEDKMRMGDQFGN
jgi:hypothetical protein